jgi:hypothetical protein
MIVGVHVSPAPVEGLGQDHAISVEQKSVRNGAQTIYSIGHHIRVSREQLNYLSGEKNEDQADNAEKDQVVETRFPHGTLGAFRFLCA